MSGLHRKVKQNDKLRPVQDSDSLAVFKVTARDQGHYKGPSGAFVTYCNISCFFVFFFINYTKYNKHRFRVGIFCAACETFFFVLFRIVL